MRLREGRSQSRAEEDKRPRGHQKPAVCTLALDKPPQETQSQNRRFKANHTLVHTLSAGNLVLNYLFEFSVQTNEKRSNDKTKLARSLFLL